MARSTRAPQHWLQVIVTPAEADRWRVRLQALADVCEEHVVDGLDYWEAAQEVHEILAALDASEDWRIATWWSGGASAPEVP
ncbi:hypothetical protein B0I28_11716 [Glycomyces artemisiae]|uniref:Uncharacterized protein n=2 Tax=Glycomyces artemisiae TaxID=1076443 RepID=A0A2T0U6I2_9ACTN|nr:hypothetical protein B0I28_11716 [Glycomyces artemisiae]